MYDINMRDMGFWNMDISKEKINTVFTDTDRDRCADEPMNTDDNSEGANDGED